MRFLILLLFCKPFMAMAEQNYLVFRQEPLESAINIICEAYGKDRNIVKFDNLKIEIRTLDSCDSVPFQLVQEALVRATNDFINPKLTFRIFLKEQNFYEALEFVAILLRYSISQVDEKIFLNRESVWVVAQVDSFFTKDYVRIRFRGADLSAEALTELYDSVVEFDGRYYFINEYKYYRFIKEWHDQRDNREVDIE